MPPTVFLLMALEASRQLQTLAASDACSLHLSNVIFDEPMQLDLFSAADSTVEMHLHARQTKETNLYQFEILSVTTDCYNSSNRHCSGNFGWVSSPPEVSSLANLNVTHDPLLLEQSRILGRDVCSKLKALKIGAEGSAGEFEGSSDHQEHYCIDPWTLNSILYLPPISLLGRNLPAIHRISSIRSVVVPVGARGAYIGRFAIEVRPKISNGCQSSIEMDLDNTISSFSDIYFEVDHLIEQTPVLKSLYFKPVTLPDISTLAASEPMSLAKCLEILTHKWAMSDIGVSAGPGENVRSILGAVPGIGPAERPRFRSIQILGEALESASERVRFVERFDVDAKFHILFADESLSLGDIQRHLLATGLLCVRTIPEAILSERFTRICQVTGFNEGDWTLWRMKDTLTEPHRRTNGKAVVFACPDQCTSSIECLPAAKCVPLQPETVKEFCRHNRGERYDAFIIDSVEKSVITTWPGTELVPYLQDLLKSANSIIWVTQQASQNPYTNVAGTLLRTLQAEQPSLQITWLSFADTEADSVVQASIASASAALSQGGAEVKIQVSDSQRSITRYLPDDELPASTGLILPRVVSYSIADKDYEVSLSSQQQPVILASHIDVFRERQHEKVEVMVEASVIDSEDVLAFNGVNTKLPRAGLGRFFAGRVVSKTDPTFPSGSQVVGWHNSVHRNRLEVPPERLRLYGAITVPAVAAAYFAVMATALCIVDGVTRTRAGDTFEVQVAGILGEAILRSVTELGATVIEPQADTVADFIISLDASDGLLVNGSQVDLDKYLGSQHGNEKISRAWETRTRFTSPLQLFELPDYREGFQTARQEPYSTVLVHSNISSVNHSVAVCRNPKKLLSSEGAYVVIGGLGGLGRYVCSWMVRKGAKKIIAISRNGLNSTEAKETFAAINASDASMEVMKADACDQKAMKSTLAQVRSTGPIKGVINMAMLLGDAPMAVMTGWQWDRALRLKIDSSWILHEETLKDTLDFFIVFSSIASVLGNRNQGGYNVGNTFLNALAGYRRSLGLTAVSIALGAMSKFNSRSYITKSKSRHWTYKLMGP